METPNFIKILTGLMLITFISIKGIYAGGTEQNRKHRMDNLCKDIIWMHDKGEWDKETLIKQKALIVKDIYRKRNEADRLFTKNIDILTIAKIVEAIEIAKDSGKWDKETQEKATILIKQHKVSDKLEKELINAVTDVIALEAQRQSGLEPMEGR